MTFDNEHMLRDFARLLREARPIPAHTAVTVLDEAAAELADLRTENARLNAMRQHCERCGGDYLATGVETGCPCALRAENIALHERVAALESPEVCTVAHDDVATCGYCQRDAYKEDAANYYRLAKEADSQQAALRARVAEQDRLLDYVAPKQCPIGIPPEHSRICSAGYCRKCAEDRLNTSAPVVQTSVSTEGDDRR